MKTKEKSIKINLLSTENRSLRHRVTAKLFAAVTGLADWLVRSLDCRLGGSSRGGTQVWRPARASKPAQFTPAIPRYSDSPAHQRAS